MKILETVIGDFRGIVTQYKDGYSYKIYYKKIKRSEIVAQSYVYFLDKNVCIERMQSDMHQVLGITKDLFELDLL